MPHADPQTDWTYTKQDDGSALVSAGGKTYRTDYSQRIVDLIVARKGVARMPRYLSYREERSGKLEPLFQTIANEGRSVSVLEPGCSAGHLSEAILRQPRVKRLVSFDPDEGMVEVCLEKKNHFGFDRWDVACASAPDFTEERFDVVIMSAMMEHVDPALRKSLVEACYARLNPGGLFVVLESQNRRWPFEYHVIRLPLPYAHYLPPSWIYRILRIAGRYRAEWSYEEFANPNAGWWGSTLCELKPAATHVTEVSERYGYGPARYLELWKGQGTAGAVKSAMFRLMAKAAALFGISPTGLLPALFVVFRKEG
jgi:2-polyprenyl-3-methyl-5-hydroxy-6-metoxy-1,4-benzoquinol methylase